ncbi:MAG: hypothetical protein PHV30_11395 [Candidatus Margulisbacteria bacterium]|nr:hypothetical protein [Candidatus Margulisiibacteriota bacterium]
MNLPILSVIRKIVDKLYMLKKQYYRHKFKLISLPLTAADLLRAGMRSNDSAILIDLIKPSPADKILYIGPGYYAEPLLACAFYGATIDIVQPKTQNSVLGNTTYQTIELEHNIRSYYLLLNSIYGKNILRGKINTRKYEGYIQDSNFQSKYSLIFLLNVLDSGEAMYHFDEICSKLFDYTETVASFIISAWEQKSLFVARKVSAFAQGMGWKSFVFELYNPVNSIDFPHGVYRVLLVKNQLL